MDYDGRFEVFQIRSTMIISEQFSVYPTYSTHTIQLNSIVGGPYDIFNHLGIIVQTGIANKDMELHVAKLSSGNYFVRMNGQTARFIKL